MAKQYQFGDLPFILSKIWEKMRLYLYLMRRIRGNEVLILTGDCVYIRARLLVAAVVFLNQYSWEGIMKLLVASVGNNLDHHIAKQFEHAAWYLIVDAESLTVDAIHHRTPHNRHDVLLRAAGEDVEIVVAGKFGESTLKLMRTKNMRAALLHSIPARHAIERIASYDVELTEPKHLQKHFSAPGAPGQRPDRKEIAKPPLAMEGYASASSRGHHHLQQYGGRGH